MKRVDWIFVNISIVLQNARRRQSIRNNIVLISAEEVIEQIISVGAWYMAQHNYTPLVAHRAHRSASSRPRPSAHRPRRCDDGVRDHLRDQVGRVNDAMTSFHS